MNDPRREILTQVAAGTLSAEEAAARLAALEAEATPAVAVPGAAAAVQADTPIREVRLTARFGNTEVIGDPSVASAVADGPHRARQEGDVMVIEQSILSEGPTFEFNPPHRLRGVLGMDFGGKLTVRMNPSLALTTKVQAGNLRISGVHGAVSSNVQAGNCDLSDFRGPLKLRVSAGNITASGRLDGGENAIHCDMGEVNVSLAPSSSVRVRGRSTMGDVVIAVPGATGGNAATIGGGAGTLECDCTMGTVRIGVE